MSQDLPIPRQEDRSDGAAVLEWGVDGPAPRRLGGLVGGLGRDPRLPRVLAGLGAAAAFASLLGEWLVLTLPRSGPDGGSLRIPGGVAEVGGFGVGYLVGLLGLAGAVALALGGTHGVRQNARVLGTGLAVALLGLLAAAAFSLDDSARNVAYDPDGSIEVEYGRGLVMAFLAVALLGSTLRLPGGTADTRPTADASGGPADGEAGPEGAAGPEGTEGAAGPGERRWRPRRRRGRGGEDEPSAPEGLTVEPAAPFARPEPPTGH